LFDPFVYCIPGGVIVNKIFLFVLIFHAIAYNVGGVCDTFFPGGRRNMDYATVTRMDIEEKSEYFSGGGGVFHLVLGRQLRRALVDELIASADRIREEAASEEGLRRLNVLFPHKRAMLFFNQPSTRTFFSFMNACHILGVKVSEIRDPSLTSSRKGESFEDTVRTLASYVDVLIMRNSADDAAERAACALNRFHKPVPVVNAGSGKNEHPTQALLDVYTISRELAHRGGVHGKKILMAGDLKRGRTVRSLCCVLAEYEGVEIYFAALPEYRMADDVRGFLARRNIRFEDVDDFREALAEADVVYMTRVQDEHDVHGESRGKDFSRYHLKPEYLEIMKPDAVIMHPLPRREEIPPEIDTDPRAAYWRQEENGLWIRAALISRLLRGADA